MPSAEPIDPSTVRLTLPAKFNGNIVDLITDIEQLAVEPDLPAKVVIDATGDLDVAASAGAPHVRGSYIVTTVFRLGGVDTDAAEAFENEHPETFQAVDREIKQIVARQTELRTQIDAIVADLEGADK